MILKPVRLYKACKFRIKHQKDLNINDVQKETAKITHQILLLLLLLLYSNRIIVMYLNRPILSRSFFSFLK